MRFLIDASGSTVQAYLVLRSSTVRQVSLYFSRSSLQGIAAGIGISNFLRAFSIIRLNSSSSGSIKKRPRNLLALSSFGFSIVHFCFAFRFTASDFCFHISNNTLSGLEVAYFLVSLSRDHVYPSGGFSFNTMNLVKPVHASDNSRSSSTFH